MPTQLESVVPSSATTPRSRDCKSRLVSTNAFEAWLSTPSRTRGGISLRAAASLRLEEAHPLDGLTRIAGDKLQEFALIVARRVPLLDRDTERSENAAVRDDR